MNKSAFLKLFLAFFSRPFFYPLFQFLFKLSLYGMNRGSPGILDFHSCGEVNVLSYIKYKLTQKSEIVLFDVGANIGDYTSLMLEVFRDLKVDIYSFEPSIESYRALSKRFIDEPRVKHHNIGLGDVNQNLPLYQPWDYATGASISKEAVTLTAGNQYTISAQEVSIKNFSDFCLEANISCIDFLKIDVEGYELEVLNGSLPFLKKYPINFIQLELGPTAIPNHVFFKDYWERLNDNYYGYLILRNGLQLITSYSVDLEIFRCTNFLFERKEILSLC